MKRTIFLSKEEKIAILRIMIEIENHYKSRFPNSNSFIEELTHFLKLGNKIKQVNKMPTNDARDILNNVLGGSNNYRDEKKFFTNLFEHFLKTSNYGAIRTAKELEENYKRNNGSIIALFKELEILEKKIEQEWRTAFCLLEKNNLLKINIRFSKPIDLFPFEEWDLVERSFNHQRILDEPATHKNEKEIKTDKTNNTADLSLNANLREKLKNELREEIIKEIKELVSKEVNETLHKHLKDFATNNFNETLYKDL